MRAGMAVVCVVEVSRFMGAFAARSQGTLGELSLWPSDESKRKIIAYGPLQRKPQSGPRSCWIYAAF